MLLFIIRIFIDKMATISISRVYRNQNHSKPLIPWEKAVLTPQIPSDSIFLIIDKKKTDNDDGYHPIEKRGGLSSK